MVSAQHQMFNDFPLLKNRILLTHANRKYDKSHTSWSEIIAFSEILQSLNYQVYVMDINDILNFEKTNMKIDEYFDDIIIFSAGNLAVDLKNILDTIQYSQVYLVIQDPNWKVNFKISCDFTLITPFKKFNNMPLAVIKKYIKDNLKNINISNFSKHVYIPFGVMLAYNKKYKNSYVNNQLFDNCDTYIYAGSLKEDRKKEFEILLNKNSKIALFGNFSKSQFEKLINKKIDESKVSIMGKVPPTEVPMLYGYYGKPVIMPDKKMIDLDVSYIRYLELLMSQTLYDTRATIISSNDSNLSNLKQIISNFSHINDKNEFFINKNELIKYFEDNISFTDRCNQLFN